MNNAKQNIGEGWSDFQSGPPVGPPMVTQQQTGFSQWGSSEYRPQTGQGHIPVPGTHAGFAGNSAMVSPHGNMGQLPQNQFMSHTPSAQQMYGQVPNPQMYGQGPNPQMYGQIPNPQIYGQGPNPQMYGQVPNPQIYGQGPNPQMYGQGPNPQMYGQSPNPQMHRLGPNPQMFGQSPNPQIPGQGPNPQIPGQSPNPQIPGQGPSPQIPGQGSNPQLPGQGPNPQIPGQSPNPQTLETPEEKRRRKEREEQQAREAEITRRKLMRIKVAKGEGGNPDSTPSLESLIGFNPEPKSKSKTHLVTPSVKTESQVSSTRITDQQVAPSTNSNKTSQPNPVSSPPKAPPPKPSPPKPSSVPSTINKSGISYDELLSGALGNIDKTVSSTIGKSDFRGFSSSKHTVTAPQGEKKVFADSVKSRQWTSTDNPAAFEGLFAQYAPPTAPPTQPTQGDDSFGEFQSVPVPGRDFNQQTFPSSSQVYPSSSQVHLSSSQTYPSPVVPSVVTHPQTQSPQVVHTPLLNNPVMVTGAPPPASKEPLPHWATASVYPLPPVYDQVLKMCSSKDNGNFLDTGTLFPVLLSSGLERPVLRDLWGVVNQTVPGTLVRHELLCLLAMIGLLQGGKTTVTLADIATLMVPPPVTLATGSNSPPSSSSGHQQQLTENFGDFQGSSDPQTSHSAAILPDNDPYSALKEISHTHTDTVTSNVGGTSATSIKPDPSDPYSALRLLEDPAKATPSTSHTSLLSDGGHLTATPTSGTTQDSSASGWAAFPQPQQPQTSNSSSNILTATPTAMPTSSSDYGDFSAFTSVGTSSSSTAPPISSTPSTDWANFVTSQSKVTAITVSSNSSNLFGDFSSFSGSSSLSSLSTTGPTHSIPSFSSTPLIPVNASPTLTPPTTMPPTETVESPSLPDKKFTAKAVEYFEVWRTCLVQCDELLGGCVSVLCDSSLDQSLLTEIATHPNSQERLKEMIEVYRLAKRVHYASRGPGRKHMTPERSQSLMTIMMGIKQKWNKLCRVIPDNRLPQLMGSHTSSPVKEGNDEDTTKCAVCLLPRVVSISTLVTIDGYSERYVLPMEDAIGQAFHCQCMDFWTKAVNRDLAAIPSTK